MPNVSFWRESDRAPLAVGCHQSSICSASFDGIVDLDAKVPNRAFELCVTEEQLHCSEVAGLAIDLCGLVRRMEWVP